MAKIHIYFIPGLAASSKIFENIQLSSQQYELHYLDWLLPESRNESLDHYARRMSYKITHEHPVLVGVSFGGVMAQEISRVIEVKKTIIISSIKSEKELPTRLKLARATKAYKLFPTKVINKIEDYSKYALGNTVKKRVNLYRKYLSMRDENYLPWAIHQVLNWKQEEIRSDIIHIHGNNDGVFPIKHIKNCKVIEGGTHIMILNKAKRISKLLEEVI